MNSIEIWKSNLANRAPATQKQYLRYFNVFLDFVGCSPDELREMKYKENRETKPWDRNRVENLLREYLKTLEEKNLSCSTQTMAVSSVRSFFEAQGMPLFLKRADKPSGCAFGSKALTSEEIRKIKNAAEHIRDKALIMFLKDSGLRQSDASKLKWSDFKDYGDGFWGVQIQTKKKGIKARSFIGSETTELLTLYKRKRLEGTKKLDPEKNIENNPVFALLSDPTKTVRVVFMSQILGTIIRLAGIERATPHGFRKFWEQNIHVEHVAYAKQMNGRALDSVERAYYWKETQDLFEMYRSNYHNMRIEKQDFKEAEERIRRDYEREIGSLRKLVYGLQERNEELLKKFEPVVKFTEKFKDSRELELFSKMLVQSGEIYKRMGLGDGYDKIMKDLEKEGLVTGYPEKLGYDEDRVQDLLQYINPALGRILLLDALERKKKAAKKQESE